MARQQHPRTLEYPYDLFVEPGSWTELELLCESKDLDSLFESEDLDELFRSEDYLRSRRPIRDIPVWLLDS